MAYIIFCWNIRDILGCGPKIHRRIYPHHSECFDTNSSCRKHVFTFKSCADSSHWNCICNMGGNRRCRRFYFWNSSLQRTAYSSANAVYGFIDNLNRRVKIYCISMTSMSHPVYKANHKALSICS